MRSLTLFLSSVFIFIQPMASAETLSKHLSTIIAPEPIKRVNPKYPIAAAREGREGWAVLSFVIDKEGNVGNVLVEDSSGSLDFDKASVKAAKKWKYKPAFENGEAIQQCVNRVQLDFKMSTKGTTGVSRRFLSKYKKAQQALVDKDYKQVEQQLALMAKNSYMHLSESNYRHLLAAAYEKAMGNKRKQLFHLSRVAKATSRLSSEEQALSTLYQIFVLQIELNKFYEAHETYNRLIKLEAAKPYLARLAKTMAKVDDLVGGTENLVRTAKITKKDYWHAALVRKEFSLANIDGELDRLDVRCANKRHIYTVENSNTWALPASWKNCSIFVYGTANSSFTLIEHPLKS